MNNTCSCGQEINTTGIGYSHRVYNGQGEVIYEQCMHGCITVDIRIDIDPDYLGDLG